MKFSSVYGLRKLCWFCVSSEWSAGQLGVFEVYKWAGGLIDEDASCSSKLLREFDFPKPKFTGECAPCSSDLSSESELASLSA